MTRIKIEVPANDHIALSAMADALQRIADERAPSVTTSVDQSDAEKYGKAWSEHYGSNTEQINAELEHAETAQLDEEIEVHTHHNESFDKTVSTLPDCEASIHHENTKHDEAFEEAVATTEQDDTLDADGIPHDKRIHSKGATRLADNTWRLRKRPADKTEEEWTAYIESVKAELKAVQDIPSEITVTETVQLNEGVTTDDIVEALTGEPTLDEQAVADLTPPVIDTDTPSGMSEANETPVAPVTPPTSLTPPVIEAASDKDAWLIKAKADAKLVKTFQELMLYITGNAKKRGADNDMIKATLLEVDPALTAIPLIATRADLIPKFVEALEAKLS